MKLPCEVARQSMNERKEKNSKSNIDREEYKVGREDNAAMITLRTGKQLIGLRILFGWAPHTSTMEVRATDRSYPEHPWERAEANTATTVSQTKPTIRLERRKPGP